MNRLKEYINNFLAGEGIEENNISLYDIKELIYIYNEIIKGNKPIFINSNILKILDICNIKYNNHGIGYKVI